jgi:hypothetical protein
VVRVPRALALAPAREMAMRQCPSTAVMRCHQMMTTPYRLGCCSTAMSNLSVATEGTTAEVVSWDVFESSLLWWREL